MSRLGPNENNDDDMPIVPPAMSQDAKRIISMKADNAFNPAVNKIPDPKARTYAARMQERVESRQLSAEALKGKKVPLGHVEPPSREKMEAIANLGMPQPNFTEGPQPVVPVAPAVPVQGVGAAYQVNQAMVDGRLKKPVTLREANAMEQRKSLSPQTVQAIQMAEENMKAAENVKAAENKAEEEKIATSIKEEAAAPKRDLDAAEKVIAESTRKDPLSLDFMEEIADIRTKLMGKSRRDKIEARLKPLDISDMIMRRELSQEISIVPGKLSATLRTYSQKESIWILQYLYDFPGSPLYVRELMSTCQLVCGLVSLNGAMLPDHRIKVGTPDETVDRAAFEKKKDAIIAFPTQLVADISVQMIWFQDRVNQLFGLDELKNG